MSWMDSEELSMFKKVGKNVFISKEAIIYGRENIEIGDNVRIDAANIILASKGFLKLGNHIHIACRSVFLCGGGIEIGNHCTVSFDSKLISASDNFDGTALIGPNIPHVYTNVIKSPIVLERLSHVTTGCLLLPGTRLKEGAVLGAMSQTRPGQTIEPFKIAFGVPAKEHADRKKDCLLLARQLELEWMNEISKN